MPTPADTRLLELLDKWLASLALHLKYAALDDDTYLKVQPWVEHQRPTQWILQLAQQKAVALRAEVEARILADDLAFSDTLEMMIFLANLVGSQHIERFIPLADPETERWVPQAAKQISAAAVEVARESPAASEVTREMPRPRVTPPSRSVAPKISSSKTPSRPAAKTVSKTSGRAAARSSAGPDSALSAEAREQVIADAVRLTQWGRKYYELAELISRMAGRPSLPEVRRVLKDDKSVIDRKVGR